MWRIAGLLSGALVLALLCAPAHAVPFVYNNGAPNQSNGNEMTQWIQAEDFVLAAPTTVTGVRFWDVSGAYQGSIVWQIYANNGNQPGSLLASGSVSPTRSATGNSLFFGNEFQNDFALSVALTSGTYWLGLHNGPLTTTTREEFYWETTNGNTTSTANEDNAPFGDNVWFNNGQEHAFILSGATELQPVPEPSSMLLLGTGLLLVLRKVRR